ncbi:MAG: hypothetical protein WCG94_07845 [Methanothrix sp.]
MGMDEMMPRITTKDAIETVKSYFSKLYGEDDFARAAGVPPSNLIGFGLVEAAEKDGLYVITCEVKDGIFSQNKRRYTVKLDLFGELKEVKRDESKVIPV